MNWCYLENCTAVNNRDVVTAEIYKELARPYKIVLTSTLIKRIRAYNDTSTYIDFNLTCDSDGNNYKIHFIRETSNNGKYNFSTYFSGCGIKGKTNGLKCNSNDTW